MVCNDVKYCPEKDADSYYGRPRREPFNPSTSFPSRASTPARKTLTRHSHCQSVTGAPIPRKETPTGRGASIFAPFLHLLSRFTPEISASSRPFPTRVAPLALFDSDSQILSTGFPILPPRSSVSHENLRDTGGPLKVEIQWSICYIRTIKEDMLLGTGKLYAIFRSLHHLNLYQSVTASLSIMQRLGGFHQSIARINKKQKKDQGGEATWREQSLRHRVSSRH